MAKDSKELSRTPLVVQPVLTYSNPKQRPQTSWRSWGGIQSQQDAENEKARIRKELTALKTAADFPLNFKSIIGIRSREEVSKVRKSSDVDVFLIYAAGGWMDIFDAIHEFGKDMIFYCRHKSGPVYLWYEIIVQIDGKKVKATEGMTILEAAQSADIFIPTLCHHQKLEPYGACRICTVEVEVRGWTNLVAVCLYPVEKDLIVRTRSEKVDKILKMIRRNEKYCVLNCVR